MTSNKHDILKAFNNMDMFLQMLENDQLSKSEILEFIKTIKVDIQKAKELVNGNS